MDTSSGWAMAGKTIVDIAREAGVSFKTVSRVINREPTVAKETREKVEAVIARLDYRPNVWARALAGSRTHLLGLLCNDASQPYVGQVQVGAMTACQRAGYHLVVEEMRGRPRERMAEVLAGISIGGALLPPPVVDQPSVIAALAEAKLPFVRISPSRDPERGASVSIDERRAAYDMTRYLLDLGHRDIGFIKGPAGHGATGARYRGFVDAMEEAGVAVRPEWVAEGDFTARSGMEAAEVLIERTPRPTAVFASNDNMALGTISAAYRAGLNLPADLSIAGFDDSPIATAFWPQLTTVRQPVAEMAEAAVEMLLDEISGHGKGGRRQLDFEIVVRSSTAPPRRSSGGPRRRRPAKRA